MRKPMTCVLALLMLAGTGAGGAAAAVNDWTGVVKAQASYVAPDGSIADITVDVVYDQPGRKGLAHGTMTYQRDDQPGYEKLTIYYHAICVGIFNGGANYSVAAALDKQVGTGAVIPYMTYEFDVVNQKWRTFGTTTLADAKATCVQQSGTFPGTFSHGYVIAK